ncbi:MAG: protein-L-isoaspartate(D-aspartate) O-methyltransferase [Bryobacteraceae bacterium]
MLQRAAILLAAMAFAQQTSLESLRRSMVHDQIEKRGVTQPDVLRAMRKVPRHLFIPESLQEHAYADHPLPIGEGQTISQPYIVAFMTELLRPSPTASVLEIGTGSGYQCAVLAEIFDEVYSIEIIPELARLAKSRLASLGYRNVHLRTGDGYEGWQEKAPFDRIVLTAAPPEVPAALIDQLAKGGRLVAPVGPTSETQYLVVIDRRRDGTLVRRTLDAVRFVPMVEAR